jgi:DNA invertase Pin-like site-specific DNA recombinase
LADVVLDRVFTDKVNCKDTQRPEPANCLNHLREGDMLHVHSIDRLARNLKDLQNPIEQLTGRGVSVKFYKKHLTFEAADVSPMQMLMLQMLGAFAEFEQTLIKELQLEGIEAAKAQGKKLGAPAKMNAEQQVADIKARIEAGEEKSVLAKAYGISRPTLHKLLIARATTNKTKAGEMVKGANIE